MMIYSMPGLNLVQGNLNIREQFKPLLDRFILLGIYKYTDTFSVLSNDQWSLCVVNLPYEIGMTIICIN